MRPFRGPLGFRTAIFAVLWMFTLDATPALAGLAPSRATGATTIASARDADLIAVRRALEHKVVAQKLRDYGVAPEEVSARLASLPDHDLHVLATYSKGLPSGGDDALNTIILLLIIVILVLVILRLLNKQVVIK
jgi:uncharacterized protein DUF6627